MQTPIIDAAKANYKLEYRGHVIVVKRDFGDQFFLIDGMPCAWGYVVTIGPGMPYAGCNAMPGATWFQTVKEAKRAIDILINVDGNADKFWYEMRRSDHE